MATEIFDFPGADGYTLSGRLELPEGSTRGWAILAHCFTCGKDGLAASRISRALAASGIGVLRFDFAGLGTSGGDFADTTFARDVNDLIAARRAMTAAGTAPSLLVGHSLGGSAVLAAAGTIASVKAVATIGSPSDVRHVLHLFDSASLVKIVTKGQAEVMLGGRSFVLRKSFVSDLRQHDLTKTIADLNRPLLILHAPRDGTVGIDNAARIFAAAKHPKTFVSLDDADHLLTRKPDADYAAAMISTWATRYLPIGTGRESLSDY
ncbi:alpha/beta hydrolase [Mesorhizobium sp. B2-3-5]|uniref:alpha/beta hydrolase family protein n=1 Tax=Mesorhizobium sp. B2-3-5 TaxID=2589958 RepID=UPI00112AB63D|nr:alpha/beta hydrolase [Mesorhizobium sp. B2-3-5]TPM26922.1 alpha/beta hydrolase [Mesorhizobium sp. B2-3-5]